MSDHETKTAKSPTHSVYHVRERQGQKGFWTRIGAAWAHADGQGFNVHVDCVPLDGRLTIRIASDTKE
ncbi:MAG: hypothetical protein SFV23_16925 [Planctomycetaceae bacterium]|nr:hypothetical protein [Planctomycetaceae bacterium]